MLIGYLDGYSQLVVTGVPHWSSTISSHPPRFLPRNGWSHRFYGPRELGMPMGWIKVR